ncbi:MAG: DUF1801 domain-containing protein [Ignavibacteriae bacterium]|nr:DUF1801 domain-containing protein [Ignavibacteriota bacterium]MCB9208535.1 DUF1801 domain-containing protein [Ignavibacteriales bacterium]MCB9258356.1 DUF1801 domain-containing protein [Ignavibacteriales bacterium]
MKQKITVNEFMKCLDHPFKDGIELLRNVIKNSNKNVIEEIKWNAPSYKIDFHFATFKLYPPKNIQLVLHTDAKVKENPKKFKLDDPHKIIKWATPDRCVITIKSYEEAEKLKKYISDIIKSWISQLN